MTENKINDSTKVRDIVTAENERVLLKGVMLNFIGNLTVDNTLRQNISADMGGLLS